jgi:hypothetical protein
MRTLLIALVLGSTLCSLAYAESAATDDGDDCAAQATSQGLEGPALKSFMKKCAAPATPVPAMSQTNKMKKCNADAKGKHGPERREFMSKCLSKKGAN